MPQLNRRKFIIGSAAAGAALTTLGPQFAALAQDGDKPTVGVGSKDFTESVVLGEIVIQLLEDAGYKVDRNLNLGGSLVVHEALVAGEIDAYVEYTGTGLLAILGQELPEMEASPEAGATPESSEQGIDPVYEIVSREYQEQFNLKWLKPWGFNNTYTLAMRGDDVEELGLQTISDLQDIAGDLVFGATQEFLVREDGLPGLQELYGLSFKDAVGLDPGLLYSAMDNGDVDVISAFATDGRIPALNFALLEDDLGYFPPYFAAPVVRMDLLEEAPEVEDLLNQLAGAISDETMAELNFQVDDGGKEPNEVARDFLHDMELIND